MKKTFLFVLSLCLFLISQKSSAATQDIIINEIGASEPSGYEWVEIYNRGQNPVDLNGWKLVEDFSDAKPNGTSHAFNFSDNTTIAPDQYAIIAQDQNKFKEKYPSFAGILIDSSWSSLNESGEKIGLKDTDGNFSEIFQYLEAKNFSLERNNPNLYDYTSANWQEHQSSNTIGEKNYYSLTQSDKNDPQSTTDISATTQNSQTQNPTSSNTAKRAPSLIANAGPDMIATIDQEITLDASQSYGAQDYEWNFGDGSASKEKITKHSYAFPGRYIITLTTSNGLSSAQHQITATIHPLGVYINEFLPSPQGPDTENEWIEIFNSNNYPVDISGWILASSSKKFVVPQNTFISPQSYLVLSRKTTKISLPNSAESLKFYYPENILISEIGYDKAKEGFSVSRKQDGSFIWTKNITPSGPNIFSSDTNDKQSSGLIFPQTVTENTINAKNTISSNQTFISSGNFISKNLIKSALAQTVREDASENNSQQEKDPAVEQPQDDHIQNQETQANISNSMNDSNIFTEIIIALAMIGIFALMWRVMRRNKA